MAAHHKAQLELYCRLCGEKNAVRPDRRTYKKEDYTKTIREALSHDITADDVDIHPPFICICCQLKLVRYEKLKRKKKTITVTITVCNYIPHDNDCKLCDTAEVKAIDQAQVLRACEEAAKDVDFSSSQQCDRTLFFNVCVQSEHEVVIPKCVSIFKDGTWNVSIVGQRLDIDNCALLSHVPKTLQPEDAAQLIKTVANVSVCEGNDDFVSFVKERANTKGFLIDKYQKETVRSKMCQLITDNSKRCSVCSIKRVDLTSMQRRVKKHDKEGATSKSKLSSLSKKQLIVRAKNIKRQKINAIKKHKRLQQRVQRMFNRDSIQFDVDSEAGEVMDKAVLDVTEELDELLTKKSPQWILWQEQKKAMRQKDRRQMRWHPSVLRWAIALNSKSAAAYKLIKDSGLLILPAVSSLKKYTHYTEARTGVLMDVIQQMVDDMNIKEDYERNVSLICDEMKLKSGVAYSSSGRLLGFTDVGNINNELRQFEQQDLKKDELATHAFMVMVRGIFSWIQQPVAYFPTSSMRSGELYDCVMETVVNVESAGLRVRAIVSDGASVNRKFYKMCSARDTSSDFIYFAPHPLDLERKIYFICDVPHLIKTTRNNLENSGFSRRSRILKFRGKLIQWTHLIKVFEWDNRELRMLTKITHEHLYLNPSLRMRVKLATQVLSQSMANAMKVMQRSTGDHSMDETIQFIEHINKLFDCLNVSSATVGVRKRNSNMMPYRSVTDCRFEWMTDVFLKYLTDWEQEIMETPNLTATERERRCISRETREGLRITVTSFVALAKELLEEEGVQYILSEKFSQDPLEEHFSKQRGAGGSCDNPSSQQVANNILTIQTAGSAVRASVSGNVSKRHMQPNELLDRPLPKRIKHAAKK